MRASRFVTLAAVLGIAASATTTASPTTAQARPAAPGAAAHPHEQLLLEDWQHAQHRRADTEQPMTAVLDELGLTAQATSITGLSPAGAAAILAQTGDPRRFATGRALVKHEELQIAARRAAVLYWKNPFGMVRWRRAERHFCHGG